MNGQDRLSIVQNKGDILSELIRLLRPKTTLWARINAYGRWGISFQQRNDLLFCWIERGKCTLLRDGAKPVVLREHDFAFIWTSTPFTIASDPEVEPADSEEVARVAGLAHIHLGEARSGEPNAILRGGRFIFDSANEALLMGMIPQVIALNANDPQASGHLKALLTMNEQESRTGRLGSWFFVGRLMELILLEALRRVAFDTDRQQTGLLAGLADPKIAPAVIAVHEMPSHSWSVGSLARKCGLSRSGFAHRFSTIMGIGAIEYLQQWRITLAKDALWSGTSTIGEIALQVGFQSSSAFSTAFSRIAGCSPKQFREDHTRRPDAESQSS